MIKNSMEIASKLAIIGLFILAIFGYFYTAKLKYELDNLKIHSSELDKRNIVLIKEIRENKIKVIKIKKEAKISIELLNKKIKKLNDTEVKKTKLANKLKKEKEKALNQYKIILWNLYINTIKNIGYGNSRLEYVVKINDKTGQSTTVLNEDSNIIKLNVIDLKILDKDIAFKVIKKRLPLITNEFIPKKYLNKFILFSENFINNHKDYLINKELDKQYYISLMDTYNNNILKIDRQVQNDVDEFNNNLKKMIDEFNKIKNPTQLETVKYNNKKVDLFKNYSSKKHKEDKQINQIKDEFNKELEKQYIIVQKLIDKVLKELNVSYNKTSRL